MKSGTIARCCLLLTLMVALWARPTRAAGEAVEVWLTTPDDSNALTRQPDLTFAPDSGYTPFTIDVDESKLYQQMDGFGAALTDSSAWLLYTQLGPAAYAIVMQNLFDPVNGIGISFLHVPMAASDYTHDGTAYSYDDKPPGQTDFALASFSITHDITYIIPVLQQALSLNPTLKILANPWSAPGWMKANGDLSNVNHDGRLLSSAYGAFAQYIVKFIQAYQAYGIPIYAITPVNEPGGSGLYPSMDLDPNDEANLVANYLGPALAAANLHPGILAFDSSWSNRGYNSQGIIENYPYAVMDDPAANFYLAGTAYHCYDSDPDSMTVLHDTYPQKDIYETECSGGHGIIPHAAELIVISARNWAKAVVRWNLALDKNDGPKNPYGCVGCAGLFTVDEGTGAVSYGNDYYQLAQASKFVRPGAYRIDSNTFGSDTYGSGTLEDVAFKNPDGSKVLLAYNGAATSQTFKVRWGGESFSYTLPAGAVVTFEWSGPQNTGASETPVPGYQLEAGGLGIGSFMPDSYYHGGQCDSTTATVDTSGVAAPAPQEVYQTERYSPSPRGFDYVLPHLRPGELYKVRLHFAEFFMGPGQREFNVTINGSQALSNFDIFTAAGGLNRAIVREFMANPDSNGQITIQFTPGAANYPKVDGIEVIDTGTAGPPPTATSTSTPTTAPTSTPTATPTATPTSTPSATATATPTSTPPATPTGTAIPEQRRRPTEAASARTSHSTLAPTGKRVRKATRPSVVLPLILVTVPRGLTDGHVVTLTVHTAPRARVKITLRVVAARAIIAGKGGHRKRIVQRVVLYHTQVQGTADRQGWFTGHLHVTYGLVEPAQASLTVSAVTAHRAATRVVWLAIQGRHHQEWRRFTGRH